MIKKLLTILGLSAGVAAVIVLAGCSSGNKIQLGTYPKIEITPTITNDSVSIPVSVINTKHNVHFEVNTPKGGTSFVAYTFNGAVQVRASYCVPCRGTSFTLSGDKIICDNCGTVFSAKDGIGLSGSLGCQSYPKAAVSFTTTGDNIVMQMANLQTAFENTLKSGLP